MADPHSVRLVDLLAPLSLVTDLGMGQPAEDAMRACFLGTGLARRMGLCCASPGGGLCRARCAGRWRSSRTGRKHRAFARVNTFQGTPEQLDESTRQVLEQIVPAARRLAGFQGVLSLIDRATGKSITITLWQDEEAMRASEEAANRLRATGAEAAGESVVSVERYEVAISEVRSPAG